MAHMKRQIVELIREAHKLHQLGKVDKAFKLYDKILDLDPAQGDIRILRALILNDRGLTREAMQEARRSIGGMAQPGPQALLNFGVLCKRNGFVDEALDAYNRVLQIQPDSLSAKANIASLNLSLGRLDAAEAMCLELTKVSEDAANWINLARIAFTRNDDAHCREYLDRAYDISPKNPHIPGLRALLACREKDFGEAAKQALAALTLNDVNRDAWTVLDQVNGRFLDLHALNTYLAGLAQRRIEVPTVLATAVDICRRNLAWDNLDELESQLSRLLEEPQRMPFDMSSCFNLLGCRISQTGHCHAAQTTWSAMFRREPLPPRVIKPLPKGGKLRVGFLSSDLRDHAIGFLMVGLLENLPKEKIEWYSYSNSFSDDSSTRSRIRNGMDHFVNIAPLNGEELSQRIRKDEIDILVDLNGMTRDTRAGVLSWKPAPIQITWLGMPGSVGAGRLVDYIIGDAWTTPGWMASGFCEKIIQLPRSYQPNDNIPPDLSEAGGRANHGLPEEGAVFCCFNQYYKFSPDTFAMWCEILRQVPDSVLWLLAPQTEYHLHRIHAMLEEAGLEKNRVVFAKPVDQKRHVARISHADLVLDTLPYNAHTTCSDALRAGVPVLTMPGETFAGRVAAGILATAGLDAWIVEDDEAYVKRAVEFASMPKMERDAVKTEVLARYRQSPMPDNAAFGRLLESLFLGLYARHCQGLEPVAMRLTPEGALEPLPDESLSARAGSHSETSVKSVPAQVAEKPQHAAQETRNIVNGQETAPVAPQPAGLPDLRAICLPDGEIPLIVDIGAAPIDGAPLWQAALQRGLVRVLAFEPNEEMRAKIQAVPGMTVLPDAVGDGREHVLHFCKAPGMNGLLNPDMDYLSAFPGFGLWATITTTTTTTTTLDAIGAAHDCALLKLDVQGFELPILRNATSVLKRAAILLMEMSPTPLYQGEPSMFETGVWLQEHGWTLHDFSSLNRRRLKPFADESQCYAQGRRLLQVDAIFMPDMRLWPELSAVRLGELAWLAHVVLRDYDCAMRALWTLDRRDNGGREQSYRKILGI